MWVMMADVADYGEWKQGKRMDGVIFSTFLAVLKLGMAISGAIVGWTLGLSGYVANAPEQTTTAMYCIIALFTVVRHLVALRVCHAALVQARRQHNAIHPSRQTPCLEGRFIHE